MKPSRGEVWMIDPDFVVGNEMARVRPALVVSDDRLNHSGAALSFVVPVTAKIRGVITQLALAPPEGGLQVESALMCEQLRSLSHSRFRRRMGRVEPGTLGRVESILARLLCLSR
ncbi:MAG: type II toxin-antitoxin system PemK/MazF family toxin [Candidatus Eremiobacterota bacterium]